MKTYVITLSKVFPEKHPLHGKPTGFRESFEVGNKIHTIRANFHLWKSRFDNISDGEGLISVRQWSGKPYASKHELVRDLKCEDRIGIQQLVFADGDIMKPNIVMEPDLFNPNTTYIPVTIYDLAANDGLSTNDWLDWFKNYDLTKPMAIIHFTKFRYQFKTEKI